VQTVVRVLVAQKSGWPPGEPLWIEPAGKGGVAGGVKFVLGKVRPRLLRLCRSPDDLTTHAHARAGR
jgi:hypothetical protein